MQQHPGMRMKELSDFSKTVDLVVTETWTILLYIEPHLTADLVALFAWQKGNTVTSLQRCYKCAACPSSCCCALPLLDVHHFIYSVIHPQNMHTDSGLHFVTNWSIRVTGVTEGWCCHTGGAAETAFYSAIDLPGLRGVGVPKEEVTELRLLGRHVDLLRHALSPVACIRKEYPDSPEELPHLIEYFCILVPLLKAWKVTEVQMREICHCAVGMPHCLFLVWPTLEDMFAYWHISDAEVSREAADAFNRFRFADGMGLGPGAMGNCQAVEALGHHILLAAQLSGWNPATFVHQIFANLSTRFAAKNRMLPLLLKVQDHSALGEEVGEAVPCPATRQRRPPLITVCVR